MRSIIGIVCFSWFYLPMITAQGWYNVFDFGPSDNIIKISEKSSEEYLMFAQGQLADGNKFYYKATLDANGKLIDTIQLRSIAEAGIEVNDVSFEKDDQMLVAGNYLSQDSSSQIVLMNYDSSGKVIWQKEFGYEYADKINTVKSCSDGGFIVAGQTTVEDNVVTVYEDRNCWVIKVDADGEMEWEQIFGRSGGFDYEEALDIYEDSLGFHIICDYLITSTNNQLKVAHINREGLLINVVDLESGFLMNVIQDSTGKYIVKQTNANTFDNPSTIQHIVQKINGDGDIIWDREINYLGSQYKSLLCERHGGGYILAGDGESDKFEDFHLYLFAMDEDGNITNEIGLLPGEFPVLQSIQKTPTGYLLTGIRDVYGYLEDNIDAFALKLGKVGFAYTNTKDLVVNMDVQIRHSLRPTIVEDSYFTSLVDEASIGAVGNIYDSRGILIHSFKQHSQETIVRIPEFIPKGSYYCILRKAELRPSLQMFVKI